MNTSCAKFEADAIKFMLDGDDPVLNGLREQYGMSSCSLREFTGCGFYLHFKLPAGIRKLYEYINVKPNFWISDVVAVILPQNLEIGLNLFITDGYIDVLEGFTYGDCAWPKSIPNYRFMYAAGETRDLATLRKNWNIG